MIFGLTYYQILWYFLIYSFLGWIVEVIFHAVVLGKVINRGFLNGPLCPVYGFGMLFVLCAANVVEDSGLAAVKTGQTDSPGTLYLFLGGMALATIVELIAGMLLDVLFHTKLWDYSDKPFNFKGYICLEFSILWGLGITMIVRILHPILENSGTKMQNLLPEKYGWALLAVLYATAIADTVVTAMTLIGLNKRLKQLDELSASMRIVSNNLSETIGLSTIKTTQVIQEGEVQAALAKAEFKDAAARTSDTIRTAADKTTEQLRSAAVKTGDELKAAASAATGELKNAAAKTTDELKHAATMTTDELRSAAVKTTDILRSTVTTTTSITRSVIKTGAGKGKESLEAQNAAFRSQMENLKRQTEKLKTSFKRPSLTSGRRLLRAFPGMKSREYDKILEEIKNYMKED